MRAAVLQGRDISVRMLPDPVPSAGRLLVAPIAAGICGSDLHLRQQMGELADATAAARVAELPRIVPGHEFSATVVEVGPGVGSAFRAGMIVTANPFTHGAAGPECVGLSPTMSGGIAELSLVDAVRAIEVPDALPPHLAALTEPLAVGLRATRLANRNPAPNVVIGCGPVGLAVILALRAAGRGPILAADFAPTRRAAAEALGADIVIDPAADSPYEHWGELSFVEGATTPLLEQTLSRPPAPNIFECVGAAGVIDQVMLGAPRHSHVVVVGVCAHADRFVPLNGIQKELTLEFSFAYSMDEFRAALAQVAAQPDLAQRLVTRQLPLEQTEAGFDALANDPAEVKVLIRPQAAPP